MVSSGDLVSCIGSLIIFAQEQKRGSNNGPGTMTEHRPPLPSTILETCLYVADLTRARTFYETLFGYRVMATDDRFCALAASEQQVLLLFLCGSDPHGSVMPFGTIPPHDGSGPVHIGFGIPSESLPAWRTRLAEHGIPIESTITWPRGGTSIYFRDPDGHLLELVTPGIWEIY
jgi:catechol 2,3-dioxygenase-like lactoylglutathione lyase family enzyme